MLPQVLGHEAAGTVVEVGPGVTRLQKGDKVMLTPLPTCGVCYFCGRGEPQLCVEGQNFMTGLRMDGSSPLSRNGERVFHGFGLAGWGELPTVHERRAVKIPEDTPLEIACVIGCSVQTGVGAVLNTMKVEEGATVLVTGLEGRLSIVQGGLANARRSSSRPRRRTPGLRRQLVATHVLDPTKDDVVAKAQEITNGIGVDYSFDGAGHEKLIEDCLNATRVGGTMTMVGAAMGPFTIPIPALFLTQEKKIQGCILGSCNSHRDVPKFLSSKGLDLESMVTHRHKIDDVNVGLDHMRELLWHVLEF